MHKNVVSLRQNYLYNKTWGSSKRKKASFEEFGDFPEFKKGIFRGDNCFFEFKMRYIRSNKIAYSKITNKTMIKIVMLMCNFFARSVLMMAFFFRKLLC